MKSIEYKGYIVYDNGEVFSLKRNKYLKYSVGYNGYARVILYNGSKKDQERVSVHRLIARLFIGESDLTVDHINGDKLDNRIQNLRYLERGDNIREYWNKLISKNNREYICKSNLPQSILAEIYNVSQATICNIKKRSNKDA